MQNIWMIVLSVILAAICAYLLGGINSAIIVSNYLPKRIFGISAAGMPDLRMSLRTFGKGPAAIVLIGDFMKGVSLW